MPSIAAPEVIRPAFLWVPPSAVGSLGDEVAELAISLGQQVGPEERIALGALTPIKADGMPAGLEAGIVCGRRQIKSWALEMCLIHDAFVTKVHRCVWSAHLTETSDDNFDHVSNLIESYDWLRKRVRRIYRGNGDHRIMLANGGRIEFKARESGKTGRGRDVNRLTLDEWLFGTSAMLGAQVSMLGAVKDRYIRFGSSPGMLRSEPLRMLRDRGRRGGDPSLSWCEWTSERMVNGKRVLPACQDPECTHIARTVTGCFLDDPRVRREVNPAYGRRLSEEFVDQERLAMPPAEYARERCGVWEDPPVPDDVVDTGIEDFSASVTAAGGAAPYTLGLEVSADSRSAAIAIYGGDVVEVVDYRLGRGIAWVPDRVAELREKWSATVCARRTGPAGQLAKRLPEDTTWITVTDQSAACMDLARRLNDQSIGHRDQPVLKIAANAALRKWTGDVWRWSLSKSASDLGTDISPLLACAWAAFVGVSTVDRSTEDLLRSLGLSDEEVEAALADNDS